MSDSVYAVVAYIARYWFAFLVAVIIWRAIVWLRKDAARVSRVQRKLPDAGYIGEWAVVASESHTVPPGLVFRATRDGWIGSARACDIRLKNVGVAARAARFYLRSDGLHVLPERGDAMLVDGEPVRREAVLRHGATLTIGGVTMQLRLFAGVLLTGEVPVQSGRRGRRRRDYQEPVMAYVPEEALPEELDEQYQDDNDDYMEERDAGIVSGPRVELPRPNLRIENGRVRRY